jgi:intracellular septation protein
VFMVAIIVAVIVSRWKLKRVAPMLWLSAILVVCFGGLTIYMHDPKFIQIKPTAIYILLSGLLFGGLSVGRPLLKTVLEHGYDGLSDRGWTLLSRNWAIFFLVLAIGNEIVRRNMTFDAWLAVKVWGVTSLSVVFALGNLPMLTKHGLGAEQPEESN